MAGYAFGSNPPCELRRGMRAADAGSMRGSVDVRVGLDGRPRGAKVGMTSDGDIFKTVTFNQGRPMAPASET
jgi:hypothetical protein